MGPMNKPLASKEGGNALQEHRSHVKHENFLRSHVARAHYLSLYYGSFRKLGVPNLGALSIRILLCRVLYYGPLLSPGCRAGDPSQYSKQGQAKAEEPSKAGKKSLKSLA